MGLNNAKFTNWYIPCWIFDLFDKKTMTIENEFTIIRHDNAAAVGNNCSAELCRASKNDDKYLIGASLKCYEVNTITGNLVYVDTSVARAKACLFNFSEVSPLANAVLNANRQNLIYPKEHLISDWNNGAQLFPTTQQRNYDELDTLNQYLFQIFGADWNNIALFYKSTIGKKIWLTITTPATTPLSTLIFFECNLIYVKGKLIERG